MNLELVILPAAVVKPFGMTMAKRNSPSPLKSNMLGGLALKNRKSNQKLSLIRRKTTAVGKDLEQTFKHRSLASYPTSSNCGLSGPHTYIDNGLKIEKN